MKLLQIIVLFAVVFEVTSLMVFMMDWFVIDDLCSGVLSGITDGSGICVCSSG